MSNNMKLKVANCHFCGTPAYNEFSDFCYNCGNSLTNVCMNEECSIDGEITELPEDANFCPYCGSETFFYQNAKNA